MKWGMRRWLMPAVGAAVIVIAGCAGGKARNTEPLIPEDYRSWKRTTTQELNYPIPGHLNDYRRIFINPVGEKPAVDARTGAITYPAGTIVVKEIYDGLNPPKGSRPKSLTVMIKAPDDKRSVQGWLWVLRDEKSGKETVITKPFCATCHVTANKRHPYGDGNPREQFRDDLFFPYPPAAAR